MFKAACFEYCRLLLFTLTWLSTSSVSIYTGTNMRTICVVTVGINMAKMVAIATLIDILTEFNFNWIQSKSAQAFFAFHLIT